jgi:hypothetical protein
VKHIINDSRGVLANIEHTFNINLSATNSGLTVRGTSDSKVKDALDELKGFMANALNDFTSEIVSNSFEVVALYKM